MDHLSRCSDPLVSSIVALFVLILLYCPNFVVGVVISPMVIFVGLLLLILLRLGAAQDKERSPNCREEKIVPHSCPVQDGRWVLLEPVAQSLREKGMEFELSEKRYDGVPFISCSTGAPLEVIYEEYEGEEEDEEEKRDSRHEGDGWDAYDEERLPSLIKCYPGTDSESWSDSDVSSSPKLSPGSQYGSSFRWVDEGDEELIEIALGDEKKKKNAIDEALQIEEENLIEINILLWRTSKGNE